MKNEELIIGNFCLSRDLEKDDEMWITDLETEESMQTSEEKLFQWLRKYWNEEF